uniref:GATA zinc finger domain-containing protein 14-like n=1 Tax=Strongyloides venezuelensis TaxID=75913 RepID=A0A0K0FCP6_STRVS
MKLLIFTVLFLISLTKLNGQQPCCIQRVLLTPTSTVYVNIGAQNVMTSTKNQQYDAPLYQNPYGYQSQQQGVNGNTLIGTGPVVTSTQEPSTTVTSFAITNAVPWNGNQTGYADEGTLRQILRDQEYNGDNNNTNVNGTSQGTTQNLNLYYQGVNGSWGNTNNSSTFENSNNLSNNNTAGINNNWTTSSSQNGNIINTDDITTNEFSDSGYIQVAGALGTVDMTESGKAIEDQKPYQGTTSGGSELQQNEGVQSSSTSTAIYHNTNSNFSSGVQTQSTGSNYNSTGNLNANIPIVIPQTHTTNTSSNQGYTNSPNQVNTNSQNQGFTYSPNQEYTELQNQFYTNSPNQLYTNSQNQESNNLPNQEYTESQNQLYTNSPNQGYINSQSQVYINSQSQGFTNSPTQENISSGNIHEINQKTNEYNLQTLSPSQSTLSYTNDNNYFSSSINPSIADSTPSSINAGLGGIGIGGIVSTIKNHTNNSNVVNISSSTFEDADIAPTTHDSDYKYSDNGYITVGIAGDNATATNQSESGDISSPNVNNGSEVNSSTQGTTPQQTINNEGNLLQSTQSTQNEEKLPIQNTQMGVELSTQSGHFNQEVTLNEETLNNESTLIHTNDGTIDVTNENIDSTTITSTLLRDSTQNEEDNITKVNDSSLDVTTISQNSGSKNTSFLLSIILVLLFIMFN